MQNAAIHTNIVCIALHLHLRLLRPLIEVRYGGRHANKGVISGVVVAVLAPASELGNLTRRTFQAGCAILSCFTEARCTNSKGREGVADTLETAHLVMHRPLASLAVRAGQPVRTVLQLGARCAVHAALFVRAGMTSSTWIGQAQVHKAAHNVNHLPSIHEGIVCCVAYPDRERLQKVQRSSQCSCLICQERGQTDGNCCQLKPDRTTRGFGHVAFEVAAQNGQERLLRGEDSTTLWRAVGDKV